MKVDKLNLQSLFAQPGRYEIPPFQRQYVWNRDKQWWPLWEDVQNVAEQCLETRSTQSQSSPHFLGAVVLQQQLVPAGQLMTRLVVDAQQRLTTLQLLLDAVQEVFEERGYTDAAKRLEILVLNHEAFLGENQDHAFKVWPTVADQDAFRQAMHNDLSSEEYEESRIVKAHEFFKIQAREWIDDQHQESEMRTDALEWAITNLLEIVVIDLEPTDDPNVIFETLNARGTPLLDSDLIKNMVLSEARKTSVAVDHDVANRLWGFTDDWWREEISQGRLYLPRIDVFLNYWLVMRKREEVKASEVFNVFRSYYESRNTPIEDVAADIGRVGEIYRLLEKSDVPDMAMFLYRWRVMEARVLTPVLLWLLSSEVPAHQFQKALRALESYLVRRMIRGVTTKNYNQLFVSLLDRLEEARAECAGDVIVEYLGSRKAHVRYWPNDADIEDAFMYRPVYRMLTRGRLRIVLEGIESELRTGMAESDSVPRGLTIEHVMPRRWQENWPPPADLGDGRSPEERRNQRIHSIGNLTLVNQPLNSSLSNAPWEEKRETLNGHAVLFLNKDLWTNAPEVWDEDAIKTRARRLFLAAAKVWPHADKI